MAGRLAKSELSSGWLQDHSEAAWVLGREVVARSGGPTAMLATWVNSRAVTSKVRSYCWHRGSIRDCEMPRKYLKEKSWELAPSKTKSSLPSGCLKNDGGNFL